MTRATVNLDKYLHTVRRIEEHREDAAVKQLQRLYKKLIKDLRKQMGNVYADYADPDTGQLTYARLHKNGLDARLLEEVAANMNDVTQEERRLIKETVEQTYQNCYSGMIQAVEKSTKDAENLQESFATVEAAKAQQLQAAVNNPVHGLTLSEQLEKNRADIVYTIKQAVGVGLSVGDRYDTMAKRIQTVLIGPDGAGGSYAKSVRIARTECHRVREQGNLDAGVQLNEKLQAAGMSMDKTWHTMKDERVRPNKSYKTKNGWKQGKKGKYNHQAMEGVTVPITEQFKLPSGAMTDGPGMSGVAGEDINCRCFVGYTLQKQVLSVPVDTEIQNRYAARREEWKKRQAEKEAPSIDKINQETTEVLLQAYEERREKFELNLVPVSELRVSAINPISADYTGVSVETADKFNETIKKLSDEYYTGFTKITVGDKKEMFGARQFATTRHSNSVGQKELVLNPHKVGKYDKMVERIGELSQNGYCIKMDPDKYGEYIATHEFAHSMIDMESPLKNYIGMDTKPQSKIRKGIKSLYKDYMDDVAAAETRIRELKKDKAFFDFSVSSEDLMSAFKRLDDAQKVLDELKISRYSLENADEFMAEAFAQAKIGTAKSKYSEKVMDILDGNFKKSVAKPVSSNIISSGGGKTFQKITNKSIENVRKVKIPGQPDEIADKLHAAHKELLRIAMNDNDSCEVALMYGNAMENPITVFGTSTELDLNVSGRSAACYVLHNHPNNGSFSNRDIFWLMKNDQVSVFTAVTNSGNVEMLYRDSSFDKTRLKVEYERLIKKFEKDIATDEQRGYTKVIKTLLEKTKSGLVYLR